MQCSPPKSHHLPPVVTQWYLSYFLSLCLSSFGLSVAPLARISIILHLLLEYNDPPSDYWDHSKNLISYMMARKNEINIHFSVHVNFRFWVLLYIMSSLCVSWRPCSSDCGRTGRCRAHGLQGGSSQRQESVYLDPVAAFWPWIVSSLEKGLSSLLCLV